MTNYVNYDKKISLSFLESNSACHAGKVRWTASTHYRRQVNLSATHKLSEISYSLRNIRGIPEMRVKEFDAVDLVEGLNTYGDLFWIVPHICTPKEMIGLFQDIALMCINALYKQADLEGTCEEIDNDKFIMVRNWVLNPTLKDITRVKQAWHRVWWGVTFCSIHEDAGTVIDNFLAYYDDLACWQPFDPSEYDDQDEDAVDEHWEEYEYNFRCAIDALEESFNELDECVEFDLSAELKAAFITAFTPSFKTEVTND